MSLHRLKKVSLSKLKRRRTKRKTAIRKRLARIYMVSCCSVFRSWRMN